MSGLSAGGLTQNRGDAFLGLLSTFVVRVEGSGVPGGSGFFIAPGIVVTCAHVVASRAASSGMETAARVSVRWAGGTAEGVVTAVPPTHDGPGLWHFPDLALITLDGPVADHEWLPLSSSTPSIGQRLYAAGYSAVYNSDPQLGGSVIEYESPLFFDGEGNTVLQVRAGELPHGRSGGPLLDLERGEVCGVVTTARRENLDLGGLAVPVTAIEEHFPSAWQANRAPSGRHSQAYRLRAAVVRATGAAAVLTLREEEAVLAAARRSGLAPSALYWNSVDPLAPEPGGQLLDVRGALDACADIRPAPGAMHPLVRYVQMVAPFGSDVLTPLPASLAERLGSPYRPLPAEAPLDRAGAKPTAAVTVNLAAYGPSDEHVLLSVWKYPDVQDDPWPVLCDDDPLTLAQAEERIRAVVPEVIGDLAAVSDHLLVEFALPATRLHTVPVDDWYLLNEWAPLGLQYPVVLRALDRAPEASFSWRDRWEHLRTAGRSEAGRSGVSWVDCRSDGDRARMFAVLQQQEQISLLALSSDPGSAQGRTALLAALYAGLPAAVWTRNHCAGRCQPAKPSGDHPRESLPCRGDLFRTAVEAHLAGVELRDLPSLVRRLRIDSRAAPDPDHCGQGLVLLWDDPTRPPPSGGPTLSAPASIS
ncbi:VMAP-related conflict system protein [Streptomyces sp. NPDC060235]|uniref:VMAP-C domain-containing protein n=1 Tax=Streptomyces sp. NPDC060235 TaxID=3347080 RepID=UPI003661E13A